MFRWYATVLGRYAVFGGRARCRELWYFAVVHALATLCLYALDVTLFGARAPWLTAAYTLVTLPPVLAAMVRRLHDTGRGGWFALLWLVPVAGWCAVLALLGAEGQAGGNRFGPDPRGGVEPAPGTVPAV
ncbi:DUF805 domain-containing protein [Streptomyces uncialis]|uniref:DUF805 domain-containing protein n=1 Tax=Streptomyces uncialis TaxID=1048205 RepID=UPI0038697CD7|nr:DUF805 domain-containing protein [Streptomyces uncialis]